MRRATALLLALVAGCVPGLVATGTAPAVAAVPEPPEPLRVLVVGDSLTHGSAGDWTWRYRLWQEFGRQGVPVDLVGPSDDLYDNVGQASGSTDYLDPHFDRDHAARWGDALSLHSRPVADLTAEHRPDVIVVMLGFNDLVWAGRAPAEVGDALRDLVAGARTVDPRVDVVLGEVPHWWLPGVPELNGLMVGLAAELPGTAAADTDNGFDETPDTWDGVHPSASGEVRIAAAMTDALAELGHLAPAARPLAPVVNGPRRRPAATLARDGDVAHLAWTLPPGATSAHVWQRVDGGPWAPLAFGRTEPTLATPVQPGHRVDLSVQPVKGWQAAAVDAWSVPITIDTTPPPLLPPVAAPPPPPRAGAPHGVRAHAAGRRLAVTWRAAAHATRYRVSLRAVGAPWRSATWVRGTRWRTVALRPGRAYAVRVQAYRGAVAGGAVVVRARI